MKRLACIALVLVMLLSAFCAGAETLGFGFVNDKDVAVRREPGGKVLGRLPKDTCVWILDSRTDKKGVLWYKLSAGANQNHTNVDYTGWMKADFIDAGEALWHDVVSVSAMNQGMVAVRKDGTAEIAGRLITSPVTGRWTSVRGLAANALPIVQATPYWGNSYAYMTGDGRVHSVDTEDNVFITDPLRLFTGYDFLFGIGQDGGLKTVIPGTAQDMAWIYPAQQPDPAAMAGVVQIASGDCRVLMLTGDGAAWAAGWSQMDPSEPEPDWSAWTGLAAIAAGKGDFDSTRGDRMTAAGVRRDGTVIAYPSALQQAIGGWTGMKAVALSLHGAIGLREDGTAVSTAWNGYTAPDVSGWTGITAVATGDDYCVGLKEDGTLVFAGNHVFMNEGHNKK